MKKKLVSVLLASALITSMLAGCGNGDSGTTTDNGAAAADSGTETAEADPNEQVGAQITVDQSATDSVTVEGEYSDADITVFIYAGS